ncbi:MAG: tetratricopeptide repeat protein, partial [Flavobacteriales bacterium]
MLKKDVENLKTQYCGVPPYYLILRTDKTYYNMIKKFSFFLLMSNLIINVSAQIIDLDMANKLFEKGEYSVSQNLYQNLLNNGENEDFLIYKIANCSKNLGNSDAIHWYELLIQNYNKSIFLHESRKELGFIYFSKKNYLKSSEILSEINDESIEDDEFHFKLGYSLFTQEKHDDAKYYFYKVKDGKYKILSLYYYAHINYIQEMYNKSLSNFKLLKDDKTFSGIVPYYITQIYFELEKYKELINYAVPILDNVISSREEEVNRLISESYFNLSDYENAEIYFRKYLEISETNKIEDYFQMGQINIFLEDYDEAIFYLEKVENTEDSLSQFTSYYLGKSYLNTGKKSFALNAFKNAAEINFDLTLKEESLYNYFKLSYDLDLPYTNLSYVMNEFDKYHLSKYKLEVKRLMINMFQSTNQYQQAFDFLKNNYLPKQEEKQTLQRLAYYIGVQHYNNANYNNALLKFEFARKYPENKEIDVMCLYWISDCYYQLKDYTKSINYYTEFIITPSNSLMDKVSVSKYNLAYAYFQSKQYSQSVKYFRKSINSDLDDNRMQDSKLRLADSYFMLSDFKNASKYYEKSTENNTSQDYALYQESKCYALLSDYKKQEECLSELISTFEESPYYQRSLMDLATLYKNQNKSDEAIHHYNLVFSISSDKEILSSSLLNKGLIYFNQGEIDQSILSLKDIIENYSKSESFNGAKIGLQNAYVKKGNINEYLSYIKKIPQLDISVASKDSLTYQVSYNNFKKENYVRSKTDFARYIFTFGDDAIFQTKSQYYYSESCWKTSDTILAINAYKKVLELGNSVFFEPSLIRLCRYSYDKEDMISSNTYYQILDTIASTNGLKRESIIRLMFGFEFSNTELAVQYAERVLL